MKALEELQYHERVANDNSPWFGRGVVCRFPIWSYHSIRIILFAVFFGSGLSKLISPESFAVIIEAYGLIPDSWIMPMSIGLPALEVILAVGLLMDIRGSLMGITVLLALFMAILGYGIHLGLDVDCGCFGPEDLEADAFHDLRSALYRDLVMVAAILYLYVWRFVRSAKPIGGLIFLKRRCGS